MLLIPNHQMNYLLIILALFLTIFFTPTHQQSNPTPVFVASYCGANNYTKSSPYSLNLNTILTSIITNSSSTPFYQTSIGESPNNDTVFGRYTCRHDLPLPLCSSCILSAVNRSLTECPNIKGAVIFFDLCTLLILNSASRLEAVNSALFGANYSPKNVSDPAAFLPVLNATMELLINETAYGGGVGFGTEEASFGKTLYTLAQCAPDRLGDMCERCLRKTLAQAESCCGTPQWMAFLYPNCQIRWSILGPFYEVSSSPPPPPPPPMMLASPPPPPPVTVGEPTPGNQATSRMSNNVLNVGIIVALSAFILRK